MLKYSFLRKYIGAAVAVSLALGMTFSAAAWNESPLETTAEETTSEEATSPTEDDVSAEDDIIIVEEEEEEENVPTEEDDSEAENTAPPTTEAPEETTAVQEPVTEQTAAPTYTAITEKQIYALQTINIRKGPSTDFDILGVLPANEGITAKGTSGEWYAVTYYGGTGYILASLTSDTPPLTSQATTAAPETETPVEESEETTLPPVVVEPDETFPSTTEPTVTTSEETKETDKEDSPAGTVSTDDNSKGGGIQALLIAFGSAVAAFLLIGVVPIVIHKIYHKKLYQY
ncbi:MAG: SH3 domain-containing protein [Ruminiclostridium sp.]